MGSPIINFEPDFQLDFQLDFQPDEPEQPGLIRRFWNTINTPTIKKPAELGKNWANFLDPVETRGSSITGDKMMDAWLQSLRSFGAGAVEGTGDTISNLTSPLNAALTLVGLGEYGAAKTGLSQAARGLGMARKALSAPVVASGMGNVLSPESTLEQRLFGVAETAGGLAGVKQPLHVPTPKLIEPPPRLALPPGRENVFIAGPADGLGQVIRQGDIIPELRPQVEALLNSDPTTGGIPNIGPKRWTDLGEVSEANRLADTFFTGHEQGGGTALTLPDNPRMALPPVAGDTRLGFNPVSGGPLPYPLNVVPEAVRPRSAQTVTRALAGDVPVEGPKVKIQFENEKTVPNIPEQQGRDLKGGTAAIEFGEKLLPTFRDASKNSGVPLDAQTITAVPQPLKEPVVKLVAEESQLPSPWKSVRTVLKSLSPELWRREVRSVQEARQYDARWVPTFENALRKLSKIEKENFGAYVEGSVPITSPNVKNAVDIWRAVESSIGDEATSRGLRLYKGKQHVPFQKNTENYWPRIPKERLSKEGLLDRLMKGGMTRNEAQRVITHYQNEGEIIIGPQHTRIGRADVPYRLDADAGLQHIRAMSKRIAQHREFGPLDVEGKGAEGIADLIEGTKDPNLTLQLMKRLIGREEKTNPKLGRILDWSRRYTAMTKLQNFTIPNMILGQPATVLRATRHPLAALKEVGNLFKERYRKDLAESGAWQNFNYTVAEELKGRDVYLIGAGETFNRGIAGAVGKAVAKEAFRELKANPNSKRAIGELSELVLEDIPNLLKQTELTTDQLNMAAGRMAEVTQGLNVPGNLPYWASEPVRGPLSFAGQLVWQLKKMGYQATKNVYDSIRANPVVNIPVWLALSQVAGELTGDTKTFLRGLWKGDPETEVAERGNWWIEKAGISQTMIEEVANNAGVEPQLIARLLDNWTQAFFLGLPADLLMSSSYGPAGLADSLFGPIFGDMRKFVYNLSQLNGKAIYKDLIKMLPIPGSSGLAESLTEED